MNNISTSGTNKYLDIDGLKILLKRIVLKRSADTAYWESNSDYIPMKDELIIFTDARKQKNSIGIKTIGAAVKIGDGVTSVIDLPFITATVDKLEHSLTIGDKVFDGSEDIVIPIYKGTLNEI